MNKRISIFLFTIVFIFSSMMPTLSAAGTTAKIKVGDYIRFGRYYEEPILWRVININNDGSAMILSEKILCLKPFDSSESGEYGNYGGSYTANGFRQKYGSNRWSNSNLREWLNSNQKIVKYTTQAPSDKAIYGGMNDYASEAGFLSNFTEKEQAYIVSVERKSLLVQEDSEKKIGGAEAHKSNSDINSVIANYETAFYENVTDKVFVLDVKELYDYVFTRGWEYRKFPTDKALDKSENLWNGSNIRKYYKDNNVRNWFFWLSSPSASFSSTMRYVNENGKFDEIGVISGSCGVAPALNIKNSLLISEGNGSINTPYTVIANTIKAPASPVGLSVSRSGRSIKVKWNPSKDADQYIVYFKSIKGTTEKTTKATILKVDNLSSSYSYSIYVVAANSAGKSKPSKTVKT